MLSEPETLTPEEVSRKLRVTLRTVYNLLERGELRGRKVGRLWRIPRESLEEYLHGGGQQQSQ